MKPVWEEEWFVEPPDDELPGYPILNAAGGWSCMREDKAKLASAAPDMARLLLELEWTFGDIAACPSCIRWYPSGHADDCEWLRAMKKAGVR